MLLVVDNGSTYTENLTCLLEDLGVGFERYAPHDLRPDRLGDFDAVILSGRKRNDRRINEINSGVIRQAIGSRAKLLGICYGAEILVLTLGGTIRRTDRLHKGEETVRTTMENPISEGTMNVFESHRYEISKIPETLVPVAVSAGGRYEIIRHRDKNIFGTQFHPEMSSDGHDLIRRFCQI